MAWEKRGKRTYYYRSIWKNKRAMKEYLGAGTVGQFAAAADALRRAEGKAEKESFQAASDRLQAAIALTQELHDELELLIAATLLLAGFRRPSRHNWRIWRHGRQTICKTI